MAGGGGVSLRFRLRGCQIICGIVGEFGKAGLRGGEIADGVGKSFLFVSHDA